MIGTKVREERFIGDPAHLRNLLKRLHDNGELVAMAEPVPVTHPVTGSQSLLVVAQVRDPLPAKDGSVNWKRQLSAWLVRNRVPIAITVAALLALSAAGYLAFLLMQVIVSNLALIVGALLVTAALWLLLGRAGVCLGHHCPGCRHQ